MSQRSRFIKLRVSEAEYVELRRRADEHGVTMSEHVRATVTVVHKATDVAGELAELRQQLRQVANPAQISTSAASAEQREMLLLMRELAAARDAQILARVRAQLAAHAGALVQREGAA